MIISKVYNKNKNPGKFVETMNKICKIEKYLFKF